STTSESAAIHARLIDAEPDAYLWANYAHHYRASGQADELANKLLTFAWLQAKLDATNIFSLIADFPVDEDDESLTLLADALRDSRTILQYDKAQLAEQLIARLPINEYAPIDDLIAAATASKKGVWFRP